MRVGPVDSAVTAAATAARIAVQPASSAMPAAASGGSSSAVASGSSDVAPEVFLARGVSPGQALAMYTLKSQLASEASMVSALLTARAEP